jgi:hypothetical protein
MKHFLKLTSVILNTNHIHRINILQNKYEIFMMTYSSSGMLFGLAGSGFGTKDTGVEKYIISSDEYPTDYKKVSDWLESVDKQK